MLALDYTHVKLIFVEYSLRYLSSFYITRVCLLMPWQHLCDGHFAFGSKLGVITFCEKTLPKVIDQIKSNRIKYLATVYLSDAHSSLVSWFGFCFTPRDTEAY
jgi:hypothetical protein